MDERIAEANPQLIRDFSVEFSPDGDAEVDVSSFMPLSPREINITITKNNAVVIRTDKPIPATYLFASKALLYKAWIGFNADFIAVVTWSILNYFGSDASDIALTPASLAPSITCIIVSAIAFSSAWITTEP